MFARWPMSPVSIETPRNIKIVAINICRNFLKNFVFAVMMERWEAKSAKMINDNAMPRE